MIKNPIHAPNKTNVSASSPVETETLISRVTPRAFIIGFVLAAVFAGLNAWLQTKIRNFFFGGVQMPIGAIFGLLVMILVVNGAIRLINRSSRLGIREFSSVELLTIYVMMLFAALLSTAGADNFFITTGPALFYFSSRENGWADLFYQYVPKHFAPGWDGQTYQREVIESFYTGSITAAQIPWHAWSLMLISWAVLLLLVYATLFFISLVIRKQWIENEALSFSLVQLPLQMVDVGDKSTLITGFWHNRTMWLGVSLAGSVHILRGLNNYFPDWPIIPAFQGNAYLIRFTELPWNAAGIIDIQFFFGAIGVAFLLTRELSFSFWFFFLAFKLQLILATLSGYPAASLPKDSYLGRPTFISFQSVGGWMMLAAILLWTARGHIKEMWRSAANPNYRDVAKSDALSLNDSEPFSPRFTLIGLALSFLGVMGWCWFSGINPLAALVFFTLYAVVSLVLARLVVEGGFLFPQMTFAPIEVLTGTILSAKTIGAAGLTRLSFLQPMLFADMRANLLPAFLHTLKISNDLKMHRSDTRRLLLAASCAIAVSLVVSTIYTVMFIYEGGGLTGYTWFTQNGPQDVFRGTAQMLSKQPEIDPKNWFWVALGGAAVLGMTMARARFLWFPFHPLAFIVSSGYPITQLWPSFFIGWLVKSLLLKFGGNDSVVQVRPFMIGLILGNALGMMFWFFFGFYKGSHMGYWPV
jgi:hypothetical protein